MVKVDVFRPNSASIRNAAGLVIDPANVSFNFNVFTRGIVEEAMNMITEIEIVW